MYRTPWSALFMESVPHGRTSRLQETAPFNASAMTVARAPSRHDASQSSNSLRPARSRSSRSGVHGLPRSSIRCGGSRHASARKEENADIAGPHGSERRPNFAQSTEPSMVLARGWSASTKRSSSSAHSGRSDTRTAPSTIEIPTSVAQSRFTTTAAMWSEAHTSNSPGAPAPGERWHALRRTMSRMNARCIVAMDLTGKGT